MIGEGKAACLAFKEQNAKPHFQRFDLLADGGLGHADFVGGGRETQVSGGCFKGPKPVQGRQRGRHGQVTY